MDGMDEALETLVDAVTRSAKYAAISPALVRRLGAEELAKRRNLKAAVKATKSKLHQVGGAYFTARIDYDEALAQLAAVREETAVFRQTCQDLMRRHASTRERLPILDQFYGRLLADLPPVHRVLDVACGLNPLALPWMPLVPAVEYVALDIFGDMMAFLQGFFDLVGVNGRAIQQDVLSTPPSETADLALILKTLPCLEQAQKGAASSLLDAIQARALIISYPVHSLGGRSKGMVSTYEAQFEALAHGRGWQVQRFEFQTELAFLVVP